MRNPTMWECEQANCLKLCLFQVGDCLILGVSNVKFDTGNKQNIFLLKQFMRFATIQFPKVVFGISQFLKL